MIKRFVALSMIASSSYALELHNATIIKHKTWISEGNIKIHELSAHLKNKRFSSSSLSVLRSGLNSFAEPFFTEKSTGSRHHYKPTCQTLHKSCNLETRFIEKP